MNTPSANGHRPIYEALGFAFGAALMTYEVVIAPPVEILVMVFAAACMGLLPAGSLQRALLGRLEK